MDRLFRRAMLLPVIFLAFIITAISIAAVILGMFIVGYIWTEYGAIFGIPSFLIYLWTPSMVFLGFKIADKLYKKFEEIE